MIAPVSGSLGLSDFDYALPESLIAQQPCAERDQSRLMVLTRGAHGVAHRIFSDVGDYLSPGDLLVVNDTKVFPCRLAATKPGGGRAELFLLAEQGPNRWSALVKGGPAKGTKLSVAPDIEAEVLDHGGDGVWTVCFRGVSDIREVLREIGRTPLPPYIKRWPSESDRDRYQTVYAAHEGAVAAPTAGLHFTPALMERLKARGVEFAAVTLHVGPGTFQPVRVETISEHRMLPERYSITEQASLAVNRAKAEGRRVIAVGTTSARALETAVNNGAIVSGEGSSELFIYPGYRFAVLDGIITNFHLPKSTLLMLVSAFAGRERTLSAYRLAVEERYRFYSYGDAMMIL